MKRRITSMFLFIVTLAAIVGCEVVLPPAPQRPASGSGSDLGRDASELRILAEGGLFEDFWAWGKWPGGEMAYLRALDDDLKELGVTHKAWFAGEDHALLVQCAEARRTGIKLIPALSYMWYREGDYTGASRNHVWIWAEGLKAWDLLQYIDGFWVLDDGFNDRIGDGYLLRAEIRKRFPGKEIIASQGCADAFNYVATMRDPKPDQVLVQVYPFWRPGVFRTADNVVDEAFIRTGIESRLAQTRAQDGFFFQFFGCPDWSVRERSGVTDWHYAPRPGEITAIMKEAWLAGKRGYYGIFRTLWYSKPGDPWIALYDHQVLAKTHDFKAARTYLWNDCRAFIEWVHEEERKQRAGDDNQTRPAP